MPFHKFLKRGWQLITGEVEAAHDLPRDIFGSIFGPTLGGVECDDADRVIECPDIRSEITLSRSVVPMDDRFWG
jgi:hypothetical protein